MSLFSRLLLAATIAAAVSACGVKLPLGKTGSGPDADSGPPVALPVIGGTRAAAVSFGPEGPKTPSLARAPDGTWGVAYGSDKLGSRHIYFSTSRDGATWSQATAVQAGNLSDIDPALFADSKGFHVVFSSNREAATWALYVSDLGPGGWSEPERLNLPGSLFSEPAVSATSHGWALAYRSTEGLGVAESADGHNWYQARVAATHLGDPAIAQVGDRLTIVAHRSGQLFELARGPAGEWSAPRALPIRGHAINPAISVDALGRPALAFALRAGEPDDPTQLAVAARGADGGWSEPEVLTGGSDDNVNPTLQFLPDGGRALAWGIYQAAGARGVVFAALGASQGKADTLARIPGGVK